MPWVEGGMQKRRGVEESLREMVGGKRGGRHTDSCLHAPPESGPSLKLLCLRRHHSQFVFPRWLICCLWWWEDLNCCSVQLFGGKNEGGPQKKKQRTLLLLLLLKLLLLCYE